MKMLSYSPPGEPNCKPTPYMYGWVGLANDLHLYAPVYMHLTYDTCHGSRSIYLGFSIQRDRIEGKKNIVPIFDHRAAAAAVYRDTWWRFAVGPLDSLWLIHSAIG